jgi:hypothetical protein
MSSIFLQYARPQASVGEPRFDLVADVYGSDVPDERAIRSSHDGKSAREGCKRAYRVQSALREI